MATDNVPGEPGSQEEKSSEDRITVREKKISVPLWEVANQLKELNINSGETRQNEQEFRIGSLYWLKNGTIFTIVFSAASLIVSFLTYSILKNQLHASHVEQRAWIKVEHKIEPSTENGPLNVTFTITNTGKTPARQLEARYAVQKVPSDQPPDLVSRPKVVMSAGLLSPNGSIPLIVPLLKEKGRLSDPYILTKKDYEELEAGKYYVAGIVTTSYVDIYGVPHWTNFCGWSSIASKDNLIGFAARKCVEYNDSDTN